MILNNRLKNVPGCKFKDQIWKIYDDDSEELIWENSLRDEFLGDDDAPDSEYHKMLELEQETDFYYKEDELDYWFEHRIVRVHMKYKNKGKEEVVKYESLLVEFVNT